MSLDLYHIATKSEGKVNHWWKVSHADSARWMGWGFNGKYIMELLAMGGRRQQVSWLHQSMGDLSHNVLPRLDDTCGSTVAMIWYTCSFYLHISNDSYPYSINIVGYLGNMVLKWVYAVVSHCVDVNFQMTWALVHKWDEVDYLHASWSEKRCSLQQTMSPSLNLPSI